MGKQDFKAEIVDFKKRGGMFNFSFGSTVLPVFYHEDTDIIGVSMPDGEVTVHCDYEAMDLGDNLDVLMNKLLDRYPQLTD